MQISKKQINQLLKDEYIKGLEHGIRLQEQRLLLACENGIPINIEERAYFVKSDIQNLRDIFEDLEADEKSISNGFRERLTETGKLNADTIDVIMDTFDETAARYVFTKKNVSEI